MEERHGYRNPFQSTEKQHEIKQLIQDKYGVDNVFQSDKVKQKSRETCIERYGVPYVSQTSEFKKKVSDTSISRYGVPNPAQSDLIKRRIMETNQMRYGVNWTGQVSQFRENAKQTCLDRYGVDHPWKAPEIKEHIRQTNLSRYGSEHPVNDRFRRVTYTYDGIQFDSSDELYYYIWASENNYDIQRCIHSYEYNVGNRTRHYTPDFVVNGKDVEIKCKHFFDTSGNLTNPFTNNSSIQAIYKAKGVCMRQHGVQIITDISEQKRYVDEKYTSNYVPLFREGIEFPYLNANLKVTTPTGLIQHFHKSIYAAHRECCISPLDAWKIRTLLRKVR